MGTSNFSNVSGNYTDDFYLYSYFFYMKSRSDEILDTAFVILLRFLRRKNSVPTVFELESDVPFSLGLFGTRSCLSHTVFELSCSS